MESEFQCTPRSHHSVESISENQVLKGPRSLSLWRPSSLANLVSNSKCVDVLHPTRPVDRPLTGSVDNINCHTVTISPLHKVVLIFGINGARRRQELANIVMFANNLVVTNDDENHGWVLLVQGQKVEDSPKSPKKGWNTLVSVVIVGAKGLPDPPEDGTKHTIYCKLRLGSETFKSKSVPTCRQPEWRERLELHLDREHTLKFFLWDKGKLRNIMGSCVIDLAELEKDRTHEVWQELEGGFGSIHLSVTMCIVRIDVLSPEEDLDFEDLRKGFAFYNFETDWKLVGQLFVRVIAAKGLNGKPNAYCTLELDNERVQTPIAHATIEPEWNKNYCFNVYDVTSILDLKVHNDSTIFIKKSLGRVSIPLLRICNGEARWYALKDGNKRNPARGNCPRVLLKMYICWNPVKASVRLFRPKEMKYTKKPPKFHITLVYRNLKFIRDIFNCLQELNEIFKQLFEWENQEMCHIALVAWLIFWYNFRPWIIPILLLIPFLSSIFRKPPSEGFTSLRGIAPCIDNHSENNEDVETLLDKIQTFPEMTLVIANGIDFITSLAERIYNLLSFKVPFLSYLAMILLLVVAFSLHLIPFNYILMILGVYKYLRKFLDPERILNNDLLDFISRIPDNEILKDWKELNVPEPNPAKHYTSSGALVKSSSSKDITNNIISHAQ